MNAEDYFHLPPSLTVFAEFFRHDSFPWDWIRQVAPALEVERFIPKRNIMPNGFQLRGFAYIHPSVSLPLFGSLEGPAWLGEGVVLEPGVVLKGNVIIGAGCSVGAGAIMENCLLLERVRVSPRASLIAQRMAASKLPETGALNFSSLEALGCVIGDMVEIGHHSVITPGSVIGPKTRVRNGVVYSAQLPR